MYKMLSILTVTKLTNYLRSTEFTAEERNTEWTMKNVKCKHLLQ